jgi:hypothetical protein
MVRFSHSFLWKSAVLGVFVVACSPGDGEPVEKGERVADGPFGTTAPMSPEALASAADSALSRCGGGCTSDLDAGREALEQGDALSAREIYACADTPEAAFGAGLSTLLATIESERGDRLLADLGLPHLPASDLFGSDGYLNRHAARQSGSGTLELTENGTARFDLTRVLLEEGRGDLASASARDAGGREATVELTNFRAQPLGRALVQYDCTSQFAGSRIDTAPSLYLVLTDRSLGQILDCSVPFNVESCTESAGSFEITEKGAAAGDAVDVAFDNVLLSCLLNDLDWNPISSAPMRQRVSGRITGTVSAPVDTSDLHQLVRGDYDIDSVPKTTRLRTFLAHAASVTEDLAQAACFFDKAAEGSGVVFELPDAVAGSDGLELTATDAKTLATAATLGAALLQLGSVYDADLGLRELLCLGDSNGSSCADSEVVIAKINAALKGASVRRDRLRAARVFLEEGLQRFDTLVGELDEGSLIPRNTVSSNGLGVLQSFARAGLDSLAGNDTTLPFITPATPLELQRFFEKLPEPDAVPGALLIYESHCDDFECWTEQRLSAEHATQLWPLGIDFTRDVEFMEPHDETVEDALEESVDSLRQRFESLDD